MRRSVITLVAVALFVARPARTQATSAAPAAPAPAAAHPAMAPDTAIVRGLYVNRWAAQSAARIRHFVEIADRTEINALVIDMKDEFGLNYESKNPNFARNAGASGKVANLRAMLDTLKAHKILSIARIVVFKDSVTARVNPTWTIKKTDGSAWRDKKGLTWVNPYNRELWEYNIGVAEELVRLGFQEVQFDYIRFPEPYKSLPTQVFPGQNGPKPQLLGEFLTLARARLNKLGARSTADIFGLVTTVPGALEVGQEWEIVAPASDVLLPMVYPSHYPHGAFGVARPNAEPYTIVTTAIKRARERNLKLGITSRNAVRPWLQAFSLGAPHYGAAEVTAQMKGVYDAGYEGWILWSPGSHYDEFVPAFAAETKPRAK
jgi:hypothetical protein